MAHGRAEERQQRVAGELLDVAPVAADDAAQSGDHGVDDLQQLLGIEPIGERREARDVREQRGDQPALLGKVAARLDETLGDRLRASCAACRRRPTGRRPPLLRSGHRSASPRGSPVGTRGTTSRHRPSVEPSPSLGSLEPGEEPPRSAPTAARAALAARVPGRKVERVDERLPVVTRLLSLAASASSKMAAAAPGALLRVEVDRAAVAIRASRRGRTRDRSSKASRAYSGSRWAGGSHHYTGVQTRVAYPRKSPYIPHANTGLGRANAHASSVDDIPTRRARCRPSLRTTSCRRDSGSSTRLREEGRRADAAIVAKPSAAGTGRTRGQPAPPRPPEGCPGCRACGRTGTGRLSSGPTPRRTETQSQSSRLAQPARRRGAGHLTRKGKPPERIDTPPPARAPPQRRTRRTRRASALPGGVLREEPETAGFAAFAGVAPSSSTERGRQPLPALGEKRDDRLRERDARCGRSSPWRRASSTKQGAENGGQNATDKARSAPWRRLSI